MAGIECDGNTHCEPNRIPLISVRSTECPTRPPLELPPLQIERLPEIKKVWLEKAAPGEYRLFIAHFVLKSGSPQPQSV